MNDSFLFFGARGGEDGAGARFAAGFGGFKQKRVLPVVDLLEGRHRSLGIRDQLRVNGDEIALFRQAPEFLQAGSEWKRSHALW